MYVKIADLQLENKSYQHNIRILQAKGNELKQALQKILPKAMAEIEDPDMRGKNPIKYIENLFNNKLGDFSNRVILVCYQQSHIEGILIALPEKETDTTYHIYTIGVNVESRSLGIGEELIIALAKILQKRDIKKLVLDVHEQNTKAIRFYKRLGFKI